MPLTLKPVDASRGPRWVTDAFRLFMRRPLAFTMLAFPFVAAAALAQLLPAPLGLLAVMAIPLLSLGVMVAGQSALLDGPVHNRQFIEPLRTDAPRRRAVLQLCVGYGVAVGVVLLLTYWVSSTAWSRLAELMAKGEAPLQDLQALAPQLSTSVLVMAILGSLLSTVYWHAPALVHWGGQSAMQALFSSALAVWRSKGAFLAYVLTWFAALMVTTFLLGMLGGLLGSPFLVQVLTMAAGIVLTAVFYLSVLFTFNDSFGGAGSLLPPESVAPPSP
jgi:hypothetical protein